MPHVAIKLYPGRTIEQKRALTERIIAAMVETIDANESKYLKR
jgi:4-oxalocrotonate tautomerase family enzyme